MKKIASLLFTVLLFGCAHADYAQLSDSATTAVALNTEGFAEGNPFLSSMSWPAIAAVKIAATQAVKLTPQPICDYGLMAMTVGGYNAALWNVAILLGSGPAAIPFMVLLTGFGWDAWLEDATNTCIDPFKFKIP